MSNLSVGQIILDAQRVASRVKDLDALGSALLVEAEGNNRLVESLRQFQDDLESLNRISSNKSNAEIINRIQQQNAQSSEILKENRELKICLEDYEYAMELLMQKYRQHMTNKVIESKINFREAYNDKLWNIIRQQREKINEMAAVMKHCAAIDDDGINKELETMTRLRLENKTLRELLQISKQGAFGPTTIRPNDHLLVDQDVQTEINNEIIIDELKESTTWAENSHNNNNNNNNNNTVIENVNSIITDNYNDHDHGNNNNDDNDDIDINKQINITANVAVVNLTNDNNNYHDNNNVIPLNSINEIIIKKDKEEEVIMLQNNNNDDNDIKLSSLITASNNTAANTSNVNNISNNTTTITTTNNNANEQLLPSSSSSSSSQTSSSTSALIKTET